ncbi:hypothetical protein LINPERHAP1_LOCUS15073, partial [Linum perenne]
FQLCSCFITPKIRFVCIVHGDLKPQHILLDSEHHFKDILLISRRLDAEVGPEVVKNYSTTGTLVFAMSLNDVLVF